MRSLLLFFIVSLILLGIIYYTTHPNISDHHTVFDAKFFNKSRTEQIQFCRSCHPRQFENEISGPHSSAYIKLSEHKEFINSGSYHDEFYKVHVNNKFEEDCMKCHGAENLFETLFKDHAKSDSLTEWLHSQTYPPLSFRKNVKSQITGVDCMTCHFDSSGVISKNEKFKEKSTAACNPKFSAFFKDVNTTCYPCHTDEYKSLLQIEKTMPQTKYSCIGCHQEHDSKGKGTHYYYWAVKDSTRENKVVSSFLNDFSIKLNEKGEYDILWNNSSLPHLTGLCPEILVICELLNSKDKLIQKKVIRINRKTEFDSGMYDYFGKNKLGGIVADSIPTFKQTIVYSTKAKRKDDVRKIQFSLVKKQQYWFPDSTGIELGKITKEL